MDYDTWLMSGTGGPLDDAFDDEAAELQEIAAIEATEAECGLRTPLWEIRLLEEATQDADYRELGR